MVEQKVVKSKKDVKKKKKDPFSVFDPQRKVPTDKSGKKLSREELIRRDKLKFAKRYELMKLFDDSIKYYKQLGMEDEVERVTEKKTGLYLSKAREFESGGRYLEAAELYDRLDMTDKASKLREKEGTGGMPPQEFDEVHAVEDDRAVDRSDLPKSKSVRWEMPNVDVESVGSEPVEDYDSPEETQVEKPAAGDPTDKAVEKSLSVMTPPDIAWDDEEKSKSGSGAGSESGTKAKAFNICPYCGEELNLPKQPRFCPYCKEAFV
ncbi:MAG: hypothetical protein JSV49_01185 [Thermoplasmata archaeon]|nr:MAG: hypothetical protein JSV49_01185 [Thermoplasmata archaeon]